MPGAQSDKKLNYCCSTEAPLLDYLTGRHHNKKHKKVKTSAAAKRWTDFEKTRTTKALLAYHTFDVATTISCPWLSQGLPYVESLREGAPSTLYTAFSRARHGSNEPRSTAWRTCRRWWVPLGRLHRKPGFKPWTWSGSETECVYTANR